MCPLLSTVISPLWQRKNDWQNILFLQTKTFLRNIAHYFIASPKYQNLNTKNAKPIQLIEWIDWMFLCWGNTWGGLKIYPLELAGAGWSWLEVAVVQHNERAADVGWLEPGLTFQCHQTRGPRTESPATLSSDCHQNHVTAPSRGETGAKRNWTFYLDLQKILVLNNELNSVCGSNKNHDVLHKRWYDVIPEQPQHSVHYIIRGNGVKK